MQLAPQEFLAKGKTVLYPVWMGTPLDRAVTAAGGQSALAKALKIKPQAVQQWVSAQRIPAERVLDVERLTGISRYDLRPDVYGKPEKQGKRASAAA